MGILDWIGIGKDLARPIKAVGSLYTTEKDRLEAETRFAETIQKIDLGQQRLDEIMLSSSHFFVNAWPSLVGWTAGGCIFLYYVPQLVVANYLWITDCLIHNEVMPFPFDPTDMTQLVYLMFGFGGHHLIKHKMDNQ